MNFFADYASRKGACANPEQIVQGDRWRITIITESLVRIEWSDSGKFEDAPTQTVICRDFSQASSIGVSVDNSRDCVGPVVCRPRFSVLRRDGLLIIDTPCLHMTYDCQQLSKEGLSIVVSGLPWSQFNTWHYGDESMGNLLGTARTLDRADGAVSLEEGLLSRDGWAILDDSNSNIIAETVSGDPESSFVQPREHEETDIYFFGYAHRYVEAIRDFYRLSGRQPLLPRFAFGNWWSRYCRYTQAEYLALMDRFNREGIPFTTAVIDMDWHVTDVDPKYGSGWTGYTWNKQLFPDHVAFLGQLHDKGLAVTLNLHPRDGVRAFEESYSEVARMVGIDPASGEGVEFDLTNPRFVEAYFAMHHHLEDEGVTFWWVDWQQGGVSRQAGLDPLWMLNHMHYLDSARLIEDHETVIPRWPLTFSRYAGPGSHRYPIGFSGDTVISWDSLAFQAYFTATASNIGYGWWSHDIGGHMLGVRDDQLEARWYQFGVFSPINRLHSSASPFAGKEPWNFPEETRVSMVRMLRLRHAMIPYLYSMNYRAFLEGLPLVQPMYWHHADISSAYEVPTQYYFGDQLIVSPIVHANDPKVLRANCAAWLPQGEWFDYFDGRRYVARAREGRRMDVWRAIDRIPVFARAGAIVPLQERNDECLNSIANPTLLRILSFPGADGEFSLYEDDGVYGHQCARTEISFTWRAGLGADGTNADTVFTVRGVVGDVHAVPVSRDWNIVFRGVANIDQSRVCELICVTSAGRSLDKEVSYDEQTLSLTVQIRGVDSMQDLCVRVVGGLQIADNPILADAYALLNHAQVSYRAKELAWDMIREDGLGAIGSLGSLEDDGRPSEFAVCGQAMQLWRDWREQLPSSVKRALEEILTRDLG